MPFQDSLSEASGLHHYRFRSAWHLSAPAERVYEALADLRSYPTWWPQIREVQLSDDHTAVMTIRSLLPYELTVVAHETRNDPVDGALEARLEGDLAGITRWTVTSHGDGTVTAQFVEHVETRTPLLRRLAIPAKPAFRLNHALAMRHGCKGLRHHLALYR
ncbi:SRPBCC family protein [Kitasatospora atroaurantiaca]|uniref:Polyketide cyclase/dehydrase/lipid transport protein n=1 Tax=Kitasatospora atroaurantiaca TaxID=285545 RepID=A0A561EMD5_9ACTN|nr:SRPBCC family protein [Kitasatospora atroaurantiaca]TWE16732.1 polyketide cyclase/dehydrase/lipid transport protein [Kitasatospora atroaurantiaca]